MKTPLKYTLLTATILLLSLCAGAAGAYLMDHFTKPSEASLIAEFYATENAVHVSPHSLRKEMAKGEMSFTLVDLRSAQEYEAGHISGAVNIPAYKDPDTSAYKEVDRIVAAFRALPTGKPAVVYCYSIPCMTGRKVGKILADHGIYVKHLGIGWNEWKYDWKSWNHEHEWENTKPEDYISKGKEPGKSTAAPSITPCSINETTGC